MKKREKCNRQSNNKMLRNDEEMKKCKRRSKK